MFVPFPFVLLQLQTFADMFVLFIEMMPDPTKGWRHDHGSTNVGAMVKSILKIIILIKVFFYYNFVLQTHALFPGVAQAVLQKVLYLTN